MGDNVYGMGVVGNKSLLCDEYFSLFFVGGGLHGGEVHFLPYLASIPARFGDFCTFWH